MKKDREVKVSYAAGIVDGEGCIRIVRRNPRQGRSTSYSVMVNVVQKDGRIVDFMYGNWGGMVYLKNKNNGNWIYEWRLTEGKALDFLKTIYPYMIVKKAQAKLAFEFETRKRVGFKHLNGRFERLTENELQIREAMYQEMCKIKKIYHKSENKNVVEYNFKSMLQQ